MGGFLSLPSENLFCSDLLIMPGMPSMFCTPLKYINREECGANCSSLPLLLLIFAAARELDEYISNLAETTKKLSLLNELSTVS